MRTSSSRILWLGLVIVGVWSLIPPAQSSIFLGVRLARAASDPGALVSKVWESYRSVRSEREESDIFVLSTPHAAPYSIVEAERMTHERSTSVVHKRAVRHVAYAADGRDQLHLLFSLPAEDAGLGVLVQRQTGLTPDDMWMFMPGYRAVRRIPVSSTQRLAGTHLLYEDLRELTGERRERYDYASAGTEALGGHPCEVIVATPKPEVASAYSKRRLWIAPELNFPLQIEYYDTKGALWKVLRNLEVKEIAPGVRRAGLVEMRDLLANEATITVVPKRSVAIEIPPAVFTQDYLMNPGGD